MDKKMYLQNKHTYTLDDNVFSQINKYFINI